MLLDDERRGFGYPVVPFSVNCYGRRVNAARGLRLPLAMRDKIRELDPPSPSPARCMAVGAAAARVMAKSPWRTAIMASSSWSHSFLTEKHYQLWPDVAADRRLYDALEKGDYATWHDYSTDEIEDYTVNLSGITTLEVRIDPDRSHDPKQSRHYASLQSLKLA